MRLRISWIAAAWLCSAAAAAQTPASMPDLRPGTVVRIESGTAASRLEGRFRRYVPDSLIIQQPGNLVAIPIHDVSAVWQRGSRARTGATIGAFAGGVIGAFALEILCEIGAADDGVVGNGGFSPECLALGAGLGIVVGGGTGAGIGAMIPRWRLRFGTPAVR